MLQIYYKYIKIILKKGKSIDKKAKKLDTINDKTKDRNFRRVIRWQELLWKKYGDYLEWTQ